MYIKAFDVNLAGYDGFQYEIGKTYKTKDNDTWSWFHYACTASQALHHYLDPDTRLCELMPSARESI